MQLPDAGDVAQLWRVCRCVPNDPDLGGIFTVRQIIVMPDCICNHCGWIVRGNLAEVWEHCGGIPQMWLRRIPPLHELQALERSVSVKELIGVKVHCDAI
jgi:hypothetical protein